MQNREMRILLLTILLVVIALGLGPVHAHAAGQCDAELDFTRIAVNPRLGHSIEMGTIGSRNDLNLAPIFPLDATLITVDKQAYSINESFNYMVRLTNNTGNPVWVPLSGQPIYRSEGEYPENYRHVVVEFQIHWASGNAVVDTYVLYGSTGVAASLRRLDPGRCVEFGFPGHMQIYSNALRRELLEKRSIDMMATVNVYLFDPRDPVFRRFTRPRVSNSLPITIRGQ